MSMSAHRPDAAGTPRRRLLRAAFGASLLAVALAGCQVSEFAYDAPEFAPVPASLQGKMTRLGMSTRSPIMLRIYKEESELEVWKEAKNGRYELLNTYEICAWSGVLGPKKKEGDRQAPEGFYTVTPAQMPTRRPVSQAMANSGARPKAPIKPERNGAMARIAPTSVNARARMAMGTMMRASSQ